MRSSRPFWSTRLVAMLLAFAAVAGAAEQTYWQLTFSYSDAGLALHKAAQIPPMTKKVETPGLADAALKIECDLEWLNGAGQVLSRVAVSLPLGNRAIFGPDPAIEPHEHFVPPEGAVVVRVEGPADAAQVSSVRLLKRGATGGSVAKAGGADLIEPSSFKFVQKTFSLDHARAKAIALPGPVSATKVRNTGADGNRLVLVFLADGFTQANLASGTFANKVVSFLNAFFAVSPWSSYGQLVNAYRVDIISNQSGADYENAAPASGGTLKDTYLESAFWVGGTERLLALTGNGSTRAVEAADAFVGVGVWDKIMVFVNSTKYGGSGGSVAVSSINSAADEIQIHEFGHSFPGLADEYDYGSTSTNCANTSAANVDCANNFPNVKWNLWVTPGAPIPTPDVSSNNAVIGAFEGAHYQTKGMFRPKRDCRMRTLGVPFCPVCIESHILRLFRQVRIVDSATPSLGAADVPDYGSRLFSVTPVGASRLSYQWHLAGAAIVDATNSSLNVTAGMISSNGVELRLVAMHSTTNVRVQQLLNTNTWTLRAAPVPGISVNDVAVEERSSTSLAFNVMLSFPHNQFVTVDYATANGTATTSDYAPVSGTLTFAPGQTTQTVLVPITGDQFTEGDDVVFLNLSNPVNATLARAQGAGLIMDNDRAPFVTVSAPTNGAAFLNDSLLPILAEAIGYAGAITNLAIHTNGVAWVHAVATAIIANWSNAPAGPHVLTAVAKDNVGLSATSAPVVVYARAGSTQRVALVRMTNSWRYDASTTDFGTAWRQPSYDDAAWAGPSNAVFYNETAALPAPKNTPLPLTTGTGARIRGFYFRTHFTGPPNPSGFYLILSNLVDDGAVFWLNGTELGRIRMAGTSIVRSQFSSDSPPNNGDATAFEVFAAPASALLAGDNVLAVEVHQQSDTSSDVVFACSLTAAAALPPLFNNLALPADVAVEQGRSTILEAPATAQPAATWQWYRNGAAIIGATNPTYTIFSMNSGVAGPYVAIVSNIAGVITSRTATISYIADATVPQLVGGFASNDLVRIRVLFSEPMGTGANVAANYRLTSLANGVNVPISSAIFLNSTNVMLTTSARTAGVNYLLSVSNVRDTAGNLIPANSEAVLYGDAAVIAADNFVWRYYQSNAAPGLGWFAPGFDDSTWASGPALLDAKRPARSVVGPNNVPVRTVLNLTNPPTASAQTLAYYFRTTFSLPGWAADVRLSVRPLVDDGAIFYLNGREVLRLRMPGGDVGYSTLASVTRNDPENIFEGPYDLPSDALVAGVNLLAVEVHQSSTTSSDLSFAAQLNVALPWLGTSVPPLAVAPSGTNAILRWQRPGAVLQTSGMVTGPWFDMPGAVSPFTVHATNAAQFFRLRGEVQP
jgi:hypothetical protein